MKTSTFVLLVSASLPAPALAAGGMMGGGMGGMGAGMAATTGGATQYDFVSPPYAGGAAGLPTTTTMKIGGLAERVTYAVNRQTGSYAYIHGVDVATGKNWRMEFATGGAKGVDIDGSAWSYSAKSHTYTNKATGRTCTDTSVLHVCPG